MAITLGAKKSFIFFLLVVFVFQVRAESPATDSVIDLQKTQEKIASIENKTNLDEGQKQKILELYYATQENLEEQQRLLSTNQQLTTLSKQLPNDIKKLESQLTEAEQQSAETSPEMLLGLSAEVIEEQLTAEKSKLDEVELKISSLESQQESQIYKAQRFREKIAEIKKLQAEKIAEQAKTNISKLEADALTALINSLNIKLNLYEIWNNLEDQIYPSKIKAQKLRLQLLRLQQEQLSQRIQALDNALVVKQQQDINQAQSYLIDAQKEVAGKHKLLQQAAQDNIHYNEMLLQVNNKIKKYSQEKDQFERRYKQLEKDFHSAEQKIDLAGISPVLGNLLREQHRTLPSSSEIVNLSEKIQQEIAAANLILYQLDEKQSALLNVDQTTAKLLQGTLNDEPTENREQLRTELSELLSKQKKLVLQLYPLYSDFTRILAEDDFALQQLNTLANNYRQYLDRRLLWIPSANPIQLSFLQDLWHSGYWFLQWEHWRQLGNDIFKSATSNPLITGAVLLLLLTLVRIKPKLSAKLQDVLKESDKIYADHYKLTYLGLIYALLLALPMATSMVGVALLIMINLKANHFSLLFANGLLYASLPMFNLSFFYHILKPNGLMQKLFEWRLHTVQLLYKQFTWLFWVIIPAVFLVSMFEHDMYSEHTYILGRLGLIINMLALAYVLYQFTQPSTGLIKDFYMANPSEWISRFRFISHAAAVIIPLMVIGFAAAGYYQSALELEKKIIGIFRLLFITALVYSIVIRWLKVTNRRIVLQNAQQKRKQQMQKEEGDKQSATPWSAEEETALLDINKINVQTRTVIKTMLWFVVFAEFWYTFHDILPAFTIFDQVVLWQHIEIIDGQETLQPITLFNALVCLLYLVLTIIFVSNFPGLFDLLLVDRYSMTAGSRYAILQLTRYTVVTLTFILIANELGGSWSQVQWLVAALGVGLGFGLQEIFANLVSGIILLFERPIRVGDVVTVGDISGKVSRIEMRATTIIDWDRKELIVPNKMFITDKLVNWTLSDTTTRVVIDIGISYDADEQVATQIIKQVIADSALILKDPEPAVFFLGLGESSLDFKLLVYVRELAHRYPVIDELLRGIRRSFKQHNIEIPYPQRDVHLYTHAVEQSPKVIDSTPEARFSVKSPRS